ncbi:hypothetical protein HHM31_09275, partial [Staphylococcus capitis]|nr:hypothetical protein [Staphylococcus capitis]
APHPLGGAWLPHPADIEPLSQCPLPWRGCGDSAGDRDTAGLGVSSAISHFP